MGLPFLHSGFPCFLLPQQKRGGGRGVELRVNNPKNLNQREARSLSYGFGRGGGGGWVLVVTMYIYTHASYTL